MQFNTASCLTGFDACRLITNPLEDHLGAEGAEPRRGVRHVEPSHWPREKFELPLVPPIIMHFILGIPQRPPK